MTDRGLVIGAGVGPVEELAEALGAAPAELLGLDGQGDRSPAALEAARARLGSGDQVDWVVVALWPPTATRSPFLDLLDEDWERRSEWALTAWVAAMGAAVQRCRDGGRIVAVVERPPPLDSVGWSAESALADAVEALVRSLSRSEGPRGVRVNAVSTPFRMVELPVRPPAPPLDSFPGGVVPEVAEAVRMLIGPGVAGVTGTMVHADCGRSWR